MKERRKILRRTRQEFHLEPEIQKLLEPRKTKLVIDYMYRQWRQMQKEDPEVCRFMGCKDDPTKGDKEDLRLEAVTVPVWMPGRSRRRSQAVR